MLHILCLLAILAWTGAAHGQPAPHVVFDVRLPPADGSATDTNSLQLVIGGGGSAHYVLRRYHREKKLQMETVFPETRVDLIAFTVDGTLRPQRSLPLDKMLPAGSWVLSMCGVLAASGDIAVFSSFESGNRPPPPWHNADASLLRLAGDGSVKVASKAGPPRGEAASGLSHYDVDCLPTPDNAVMLGGGHGSGPGPHRWWMGKLGLDGARRWEAPAKPGLFTSRVVSIGLRPDGSVTSIIDETDGARIFILRRNAPDGKLLAKHSLKRRSDQALVLREGSVLVNPLDEKQDSYALVLLDDGGNVRHQAAWSFLPSYRMIAVGNGFAMMAGTPGSGDLGTVVRFDARGAILWRSAAARFSDIASTRNGGVVALIKPDGGSDKTERLVSFANPQPR